MPRYHVVRHYSFEFESDEEYDPESEEGVIAVARKFLETHPEPEIYAEIMGVFEVDDDELYDASDFLDEHDQIWLPIHHHACDHEGCTTAGHLKLMKQVGGKFYCPDHAKKARGYRSAKHKKDVTSE